MSQTTPNHESPKGIHFCRVNGEPWFYGKDVAKFLGYPDATEALRKIRRLNHVPKSEKSSEIGGFFDSPEELDQPNAGQNVWFLNESGFYALMLSSHTDFSKRFQAWVLDEVLPSAVMTGKYTNTNSDAAQYIDKQLCAEIKAAKNIPIA